jgi:hypothetical protein
MLKTIFISVVTGLILGALTQSGVVGALGSIFAVIAALVLG